MEKKRLFLFDQFGECFEVEPLCLLDFYVSTDFQRQGFGKELFEFMLEKENLETTDLPIDSPSTKMLSFMRKHFNQSHPLRQSNNFVVFPLFFQHVNRFLVPRRSLVRDTYSLVDISHQAHTFSRFSEENYRKPKSTHSIAPFEEVPTEPSKIPNSVTFVQNSTNRSPLNGKPTEPKNESLLIDTHKGIGPVGNISFNGIQPVRELIFNSCTSSKRDFANSAQLRDRTESSCVRSIPAARYSKRLEIAAPSNSSQNRQTLSNSKIDNLLRWHERKPGYDYQKASWTNNRHTRLW
nr:alpha tubulin N acetyltransferase [Hymenolepis microstoma]